MNTHTDRRTFLRQAGLGGLALGVGPSLLFGQAPVPALYPGMVVRERMPLNLESAYAALDGFITPNSRFYVRSHFPVPAVDPATWRLRVDGAVKQELTLDLDTIRKMPSKTFPVTLECAGNGRAHLTPTPAGLHWDLGAVGNAEWTGVPLAAVLEKAGLSDKAVEVVLTGADMGDRGAGSPIPGVVSFERSIPLEKAKRPEVLLAFQMNGKDLPVQNGFPLRAIVGGWYGMASVKWLSRITVVEKPFTGVWQTFDYTTWQRDGDRMTLVPCTTMAVKSQIARPVQYETIPTGSEYRVFGSAWAGESDIAKVEVSTNGGKTWQESRLLGESVPFAWRLWEYAWKTPKDPGQYRLLARATDRAGRTQPEAHDRIRKSYQIHHTLPIDVTVR